MKDGKKGLFFQRIKKKGLLLKILFFLPLLIWFWNPIVSQAIGFALKSYFSLSKGWEFDYRKAKVDQGIVFEDWVLKGGGSFEAKSEVLRLFPFRRHLEVDSIDVLILEPKSNPLEMPSWTFSLKNGKVRGEGLSSFAFEAKRSFPEEFGQFSLSWGERSLHIEAGYEPKGLRIHGEALHFNPLFLKRWIGSKIEGDFTGKIHLLFQDGKWDFGAVCLAAREVSWEEVASNLSGHIDWEGPFFNWEEARLKIILDEGSVFSQDARLENVKGELSYFGKMGAKWEIGARGWKEEREFPVSWKGRGFFQSQKEEWIDSEFIGGETKAAFKGKKEKNWLWKGELSTDAFMLRFFQSFLLPFFSPLSRLEVEEGTLEISGQKAGPFLDFENWEIASLKVSKFQGKIDQERLFFQELTGSYSTIQEKGDFDLKEALLYTKAFNYVPLHWSGFGTVREGKKISSLWKGAIDQYNLEADLQGALDQFALELAVFGKSQGHIRMEGAFSYGKLFFFIEEGRLDDLEFSGKSSIDSELCLFAHLDQFKGSVKTLKPLLHIEGPFEGVFESIGNGFTLLYDKKGFWDWSVQALLSQGSYKFSPYAEIQNIEVKIYAEPKGFDLFDLHGSLLWGKSYSLYSPMIQSKGQFDIRLTSPIWDYVRLAGEVSKEGVDLDLEKSHFFGAPIRSGRCFFSQGDWSAAELEMSLSWNALSSFLAHFDLPKEFLLLPIEGSAEILCSLERTGGSEVAVRGKDLAWDKRPFSLNLYAHEEERGWKLEHFSVSDFEVNGDLSIQNGTLHIANGQGKKGEELAFDFEGRGDLSKQAKLFLSNIKVDLSKVSLENSPFSFPIPKIEGRLEGAGHLCFGEKFETDFDLTASLLKVGEFAIKNEGPVHLYYSPKEGFSCRGLDVKLKKEGEELPWSSSKIEHLHIDATRCFWVFTHSRIHLPSDFLSSFTKGPELLKFLDANYDIDILADVECSFDFSFINCFVREGFVPFQGALRHVKNLHFLLDNEHIDVSLCYTHQGIPLEMALKADFEPEVKGQLILKEENHPLGEGEMPLFVDWTADLEKGFEIQTLVGSFGGVEALFHRDSSDSLIGSARIDFRQLSQLVPPKIAEVFQDLKMGKGYEAKGRLNIAKEGLFFSGLLSGKQFELFEYDLRTLLGHIELTPTKVHLYDIKLSDSAGIMKIDQILCEEKPGEPWTIAIPKLTILELRPSLLQKVGEKGEKEVSPLVVRELKIVDFQGLLEESNTYTARGELTFINSYRRESTVFDLAPDMLSRIAGLDIEILIPASGLIRYELKNRHFHLTELKESYSEGKRTEFFLAKDEREPTVDLDGNVKILIKMKQFVLFKFTESFLISIEGKLDDPKFQLQRRKRFLGLY